MPSAPTNALIAGGLLWAAAGLAYHRRIHGACPRCGRTPTVVSWTTPDAAAPGGRWAVAVAVAVPTVYATTRLAWAVGIPLGISRGFLNELHTSGAAVVGGGLGVTALGGALLSLGLVQGWGEVFPRWIPWLG